MKHLFSLCALALMLSLQLVGARGASAQELSAPEILQKSLQTYAQLPSYRGTCAVTNEQISQFGEGAPQHHVFNAQATFSFERGQQLSIRGRNILGNRFAARSTPGEVWVELGASPTDGAQPPAAENARHVFAGLDDSEIAGKISDELFGLTQGAASIVPTMLAGDSPANPLRRSVGATLLPAQTIVGDECYVVRFAISDGVTTFWVDKRTFLLRRMQEERNAQTLDKIKLGGSMNIYVFVNDTAK